jgi:hypothetical protein
VDISSSAQETNNDALQAGETDNPGAALNEDHSEQLGDSDSFLPGRQDYCIIFAD